MLAAAVGSADNVRPPWMPPARRAVVALVRWSRPARSLIFGRTGRTRRPRRPGSSRASPHRSRSSIRAEQHRSNIQPWRILHDLEVAVVHVPAAVAAVLGALDVRAPVDLDERGPPRPAGGRSGSTGRSGVARIVARTAAGSRSTSRAGQALAARRSACGPVVMPVESRGRCRGRDAPGRARCSRSQRASSRRRPTLSGNWASGSLRPAPGS